MATFEGKFEERGLRNVAERCRPEFGERLEVREVDWIGRAAVGIFAGGFALLLAKLFLPALLL